MSREAKSKTLNDTGLSAIANNTGSRMVNRNGTYNVVKVGGPAIKLNDTYHYLITMPWWKFNIGVLCVYAFVNTVFATAYFFIGLDQLTGIVEGSAYRKFLDAFFFSAQTLTTVGYGRIAPVGISVSILAAAEGMVGLLGFALATGLLYGRFSRPQAGIVYSRVALVSPFKGHSGFMFRIANSRRSELTDVEVQVSFALNEDPVDGKVIRKFYQFPLEVSKINMFPLNWTLVHDIKNDSPFYKITKEELIARNGEILITIKAFDLTFSQTVYSRASYKAEEIFYGGKFIMCYETKENGKTYLYLNRLSEYDLVDLPVENQVSEVVSK